MILRSLHKEDAPYMLEWMHDKSIVEHMQADFANKTLDDCIGFIESSKNTTNNLHLAIADDNNVYQGTVSLKNITENTAEFGIVVRRYAMGAGVAKEAMNMILEMGFKERNLNCIYWCVSPYNKRAVRFYEKGGYERINVNRESDIYDAIIDTDVGGYHKDQIEYYYWYRVEAEID